MTRQPYSFNELFWVYDEKKGASAQFKLSWARVYMFTYMQAETFQWSTFHLLQAPDLNVDAVEVKPTHRRPGFAFVALLRPSESIR
jgi:hypothetical protein